MAEPLRNDTGQLVPRRTTGSVKYGWQKKVDMILVCRPCHQDGVIEEWESNEVMGMVKVHFDRAHPAQEVQLELLWLGQGPAPTAGTP